jgi:preprotein translocase subunit SecD
LLLEVDANAVRKEQLQSLADDVLRVLRQARIPFTGRSIAATACEVHITKDTDVDTRWQAARAVAAAVGHSRCVGPAQPRHRQNGGTITLTPSDAAMTERVRQAVDQSIQIIERRVNELGLVEPTIQREGVDRILVQVPGLQDPTRLKDILGKTAKLDFRMVDPR